MSMGAGATVNPCGEGSSWKHRDETVDRHVDAADPGRACGGENNESPSQDDQSGRGG